DKFTYVASAGPPVVTGISPNSGPGGTVVTITGTGLTGATSVGFGGAGSVGAIVTSDNQIKAVSPAAGAGTVDLTVTTPVGTSAVNAADQFTYVTISTLPLVAGSSAGSDGVAVPGPSGGSGIGLGTPPGVNAQGYYVDPGLNSQLVSSIINIL